MGNFRYKPSGKSSPGGQKAAGSRLAAQLEGERFPSSPTAPQSDPTSPTRTKINFILIGNKLERTTDRIWLAGHQLAVYMMAF